MNNSGTFDLTSDTHPKIKIDYHSLPTRYYQLTDTQKSKLPSPFARDVTVRLVPRVYPLPTIPTRSSTHDALVKLLMDKKQENMRKEDCRTLSGYAKLEETVQLVKERSGKMK